MLGPFNALSAPGRVFVCWPLRQHLRLRDLRAKQPVQVWLRFSLTGYDSTKPNVILKLEQGEEPWVAEGELPCQSHPGKLGARYSFEHPPPPLWEGLRAAPSLQRPGHTSQAAGSLLPPALCAGCFSDFTFDLHLWAFSMLASAVRTRSLPPPACSVTHPPPVAQNSLLCSHLEISEKNELETFLFILFVFHFPSFLAMKFLGLISCLFHSLLYALGHQNLSPP